MEKVSPKMAAAMGVGFLGFIFAAYSYNKYHVPEYSEDVKKIVKNEEDEANGAQINTKEKKANNDEKNTNDDEKKTNWKKFWHGAYNTISSEKPEKSNDNDDSSVKSSE